MTPQQHAYFESKRCQTIKPSGQRCKGTIRPGCKTCAGCVLIDIQGDDVKYASVLGPTLKQAVADQATVSLDDRVSLMDELSLVRDTALVHVEKYSQAREAYSTAQSKESYRSVIFFGNQMLDALKEVKDFALSASKIINEARKSYSALDLNVVIEQFLAIVASEAPGNIDVLELRDKVQSQLLLPEQITSKSGQSLAVEIDHDEITRQFQAMSASVPISSNVSAAVG